ncbi:hypothetical protein KQI21_00005 [Virgibacillus proomii]|nr:hypothetical protein [Virgibacillus proomii]MBU5265270.1 hypothetical protein [Virgibacillus proomii]
MMSLAGIGSIIGSVLSTYIPEKFSIKHYLGIGSSIGASGYVAFYSSINIIMAGISFIILGFFLAYASIGYITFFQNNVPKETMGRVGSIVALLQGCFQIIITLIIGYFSLIISLKIVTISFSLIALLISISLYIIIIRRNENSVHF